jgi:hypothetical protein
VLVLVGVVAELEADVVLAQPARSVTATIAPASDSTVLLRRQREGAPSSAARISVEREAVIGSSW